MTSSASRAGRAFLYFLVVVVVIAAGAWTYLRFGRVPVAVADSPFPFEEKIVSVALDARIGREMETGPMAANEAVFKSGARTYVEECAMCHGTPGGESVYAKSMYPAPPQLWKKHGTQGVVGVSDNEVGATFWVVKNGVRLTGMPSFEKDMTDEKMWQIALLLKNADKEMPASVDTILKETPQ